MNKGQSLYELIVAIAICALITVAVITLATSSILNSNYSKNKSVAGTYAQQATEWLRGQRNANITNFINKSSVFPGKTWCLQDSPLTDSSWKSACSLTDTISGTQFLRQVKLITTTFLTKTQIEADVTVSWTDSKGIHLVTDATNFSDLRQR